MKKVLAIATFMTMSAVTYMAGAYNGAVMFDAITANRSSNDSVENQQTGHVGEEIFKGINIHYKPGTEIKLAQLYSNAPNVPVTATDKLLQMCGASLAYSYDNATPHEQPRIQKTPITEPAKLLLLGSCLCLLVFCGKRHKDTPQL